MQRAPKRYAGAEPLDREQVRRRGLAVRYASVSLGDTAAALAFLNEAHDGLGGRPIDIATASEDGLEAVRVMLEPA
ncbi:antitoxin Xre/MbcA/ParS toxin-binding domain-containing protein [Sphingoaurantiacus capsulatus]|uniref:Antitoxin Xre/MbcA/ParS toxin-binding domain-containing protein n=1 Tax=Sphingoaurantiacus capsulatus TaxID=1771310 RepID=A0ABV7X4F2_9SPHN